MAMCGHQEPIVGCRVCLMSALADNERLRAENLRASEHAGDWMGRVELHVYTERMLKGLLRVLLISSVPHPVHHPTMWRAWRIVEGFLGIPEAKSRTIGTSDNELAASLLRNPCPACAVQALDELEVVHPRFHTCEQRPAPVQRKSEQER